MRALLPPLLFTLTCCLVAAPESDLPDQDPFLWLEEVTSERALDWVESENEQTMEELAGDPAFSQLRERLLSIYDSRERIPYVSKIGRFYYNFWRDADHVRGIWRRTTPEEYEKPEPAWQTVIDLDALARAEGESWVWKGVTPLQPNADRVLVRLSRGGGDAVVVREFDLDRQSWVDGGFQVPEAKSYLSWIDRDTVMVGTDFGAGSMTASGYPRVVKLWRRGQPLDEATTLFEAQPDDLGAFNAVHVYAGGQHQLIVRAITFYTSETWLRQPSGEQVKLDLPLDVQVDLFQDHLLVQLRSAWTPSGRTFPAGALLTLPLADFLAGQRDFEMLFEPGPRTSLAETAATRHHLLVNELDNVRHRVYVLTPTAAGWRREPLAAPEFGAVAISGIDPLESDGYFLQVADFLTPASLLQGTVGGGEPELLKQLPHFFNPAGLEITQHEATSADGTRVPYFQVGLKARARDGSAPTLLYGYGGFEVSMLPSYSAGVGAGWLEQGGVYVLANIRGGGEFGPAWHQAALKENRQRAYDDFIAVAEDLIERRVTSPRHLGIMGGSNGGLLVGVMLTQRPDLFGAVVCQVPLLDMRRYHLLLAGASWMGEYGNPDVPEEWAYISKYSPYQHMKPGVDYPPTLFLTSTRDDRVHPGHARKMAALMDAQGHEMLYYENTEGGHAGAADNRQQALMSALAFRFLQEKLAEHPDQAR